MLRIMCIRKARNHQHNEDILIVISRVDCFGSSNSILQSKLCIKKQRFGRYCLLEVICWFRSHNLTQSENFLYHEDIDVFKRQ